MSHDTKKPGAFMAAELAQASDVFVAAASRRPEAIDKLETISAIYTIARGSSDAAANILSYEFMRELGLPVTSLPPSVFSIGKGVDMRGALGLVISQSGASDDLVRTAKGIAGQGGHVLALTNVPGSPVEAAADATLPIAAGEERAVPATKTVVGSVAAGLAVLAAMSPTYAPRLAASAERFAEIGDLDDTQHHALTAALLRARHVYVVGRDTGYGAAQEIALKLKETCAIHAEAYSASEVLHGPLQLATNPLTVLVLKTAAPGTEPSLTAAVERFRAIGADVHIVTPAVDGLTPAAGAAALLRHLYPVILQVALSLGLDPDVPSTLSKVTVTT